MFNEEYIKEKDVVDEGFISRYTLIRARHNGLPFRRIGAYVCYKKIDLEEFFCQPRVMNPKGRTKADLVEVVERGVERAGSAGQKEKQNE